MRFKIDENLPEDYAEMLAAAGHDAVTAVAQGLKGQDDPVLLAVCEQEGRILVTLDLGFSDVRTYPPQRLPGMIVVRAQRQDKAHLLNVFQRAVAMMGTKPLEHRLWIVEETRIRIRGGE